MNQPTRAVDAEAGNRGARLPGRIALALLAASTVLVVLTGALGPSAAEAPLPGRAAGPPFWFAAKPPPWLVTALLDIAIVVGGAGLLLALTALRRGWRPPLKQLIPSSYIAAVAAVLVPPMGSADHLVYAAYGRLATTGGNPYRDTAHILVLRGDPIGLAVQPPWTDTASVYGPVATAEQALASWIGGDSPHTTVFVLAFIGAAAFVAMGAMLRRLGDPARVTLLFSLNPLLLFETVNAAHLDAFAVLFAVAAIYVLHVWRGAMGAVVAGGLIGLGCATKLSIALAALAGLWALRHRPRQAALFGLSAATMAVLVYVPYGSVAFAAARNAARMVSLGSAWRPLLAPFQHAVGDSTARDLISTAGWLTMAALVWLLAPTVRGDSGLLKKEREASPSPGTQAAQALALLGLAWILVAPYTLPWYDIVAWAPLAVCAAGPLDLLITARGVFLSMAYVPGLVVALPAAVAGWASWIRADAAPTLSIGAVAACVLLGVRLRTRVPRPR
jgi:alpha-1,6-mannosyltransferase